VTARRILSVVAAAVLLAAALYVWYVRGFGLAPQPVSTSDLRWEVKAPLPHPRTEVAAALWRGRIAVIGGIDGLLRTTGTVQIYDPVADTWVVGPPLPRGVHHAMAAGFSDRVYLIGGLTGIRFAPATGVYVFNGTWREAAELPEPLGAGGIAVLDERIHVVSGVGRGGNVAAHYAYDPAAARWERRAVLPLARDHLALASFQGRLYAIGGRLGGKTSRNTVRVDIYDPGRDAWTAGPRLGHARSGHAAVAIEGRILIVGGEEPGGTIGTVEAFEGDRWTVVTRMPSPRHGLGAVALGATVYTLSGGKRPGFSMSGANEALILLGPTP